MSQLPRIQHGPELDLAVDDIADAQFATHLGVALDGWQSYAAATASRVDPAGAYLVRDVGILTGRQNGKTELATVRSIRAALLDDQRVLFTTRGRAMAHEALRRAEQMVTRAPNGFMREQVIKVRRSAGTESIEFAGGGVIDFRTYNGDPGDGNYDLIVVDDAHALCTLYPVRWEYKLRPGGQVWWLGTVPHVGVALQSRRTTQRSAVSFAAVHARAVHGDQSVTWLEWSAAELADVADAIRAANPAVGSDRIRGGLDSKLERLRELMPEDLWRAEVLNIGTWPDVVVEVPVGG